MAQVEKQNWNVEGYHGYKDSFMRDMWDPLCIEVVIEMDILWSAGYNFSDLLKQRLKKGEKVDMDVSKLEGPIDE